MARRAPWRTPAWDFIAVPLLLIAAFHVVPCIWGIGLSSFRYDAIGPAQWAGLDNYRRLVQDATVGTALVVTTLVIASLSAGLYVMNWPLMMAAATFVIAPVLLAFLAAQRFFTRSIALAGLK